MILGFDLETTGLDPYAPGARILCGTLGPGSWIGAKVPSRLRDVAWMPEHTLVGHNLGFDLSWLPFEPKAQLFDTMVANHRLDENSANSLEAVAQRWLGEGKLEAPEAWEEADEAMLAYNQRDADLCRRLHEPLSLALQEQGLWPVFERDMRLLKVLVRMRRRGVRVDWIRLSVQRDITARLAQERLDMIREKYEVAPRSGKSVGAYLYEAAGLPIRVRTPKGTPATNREALVMAKQDADEDTLSLLDALLEYRHYDKLCGGFLAKLPAHAGVDGRLHTTFHLGRGGKGAEENGAISGRLSSSNPNLQNIPKKDLVVRSCIVPSAGMEFTRADYSQVELRIAAWLSGDPVMRGIFSSGQDFHTATLAKLERVPYDVAVANLKEIPAWKTKRDACKRVNFGSLYGGYPKKIWQVAVSDGFDVSPAMIEKIWFEQRRIFAHFWAWAEAVGQIVVRDERILAPLGIYRRFPGLTSETSHAMITRAQRQAVNHLVQNTAAEIMLYALLGVEEGLNNERAGSLLLTVHDEVLVEHPPETRDLVSLILRRGMTSNPMEIMAKAGLPDLEHLNLEVEISAGLTSWAG